MAIGVYQDGTGLDQDVADMRRTHRYATRIDDEGRKWLVLVEGTDPAPLRPLEQYGFDVK